MIDLWKVKENFSTLVVETEPWTLAQFVMWLDLKISEYKIKGFMVLDHQTSTKPRWMSPDNDTDPDTDVAPQPPPCRKCNKEDNPPWEPYRVSHNPPTHQGREHKRQRFTENYTRPDQTRVSNRRNYIDVNYNSEAVSQNRHNTAVIDLENIPEATMYITGNVSDQNSSQRRSDEPKSINKQLKRNVTATSMSSRGQLMGPSTLSNPYYEKQKQENVSYTVSSPSDSSQLSSHSVQANNSKMATEGSVKRSGGQEGQSGNQLEDIVPVYLHTNVNTSDNQNFEQKEEPSFVLAEVKQEEFESSMTDMSGFDEEMQMGNDSRASYSDDEQGSNLYPQDDSQGGPFTHTSRAMSFAASNVELPTFEDPLVRRVLEDGNNTPSRHMWSKIISRCAYHMLSKGVPHKHDYQAFSEAFYHRFPCVGTNRGPHPWSNLAKQLSQKVRKIRWNHKRKTQEEISSVVHYVTSNTELLNEEDY